LALGQSGWARKVLLHWDSIPGQINPWPATILIVYNGLYVDNAYDSIWLSSIIY